MLTLLVHSESFEALATGRQDALHLAGGVPQRDVAGRHYLTKGEISALYFGTHQMTRPKGWDQPINGRQVVNEADEPESDQTKSDAKAWPRCPSR